jgi:hypothetical protein
MGMDLGLDDVCHDHPVAQQELDEMRAALSEAREALVRHQTEPDPDDPDGWIRRSALNHWCERTVAAEAALAEAREAIRDLLDGKPPCAAPHDAWLYDPQRARWNAKLARLRKVVE